LQGSRLKRGYRHALTVDGIGAADRVAEHQQPRGETLHLVIPSPRAARITEDSNVAEGFTALQRPQQRRRRELRRHPNHGGQVTGWFVLRQAGDGEYPRIMLVHRKRATRWPFRFRNDRSHFLVDDPRRNSHQ
jgi:hypothetical protein